MAQPCGCNHELSSREGKTAFLNGENSGVKPGDVICIQAGIYNYIRITEIHGTADNPVVIVNCGGPVKIDLDGHNNHGFIINNSTHFVATGTGDSDYPYGFEIFKSPHEKTQTGLAVGIQVSDLELDHFYIHDVELGLHLLNVPGCDPQTWRDNWVMKNVKIHDFLIRNTTKEGMYIGSSKYLSGYQRNCDDSLVVVMPSYIHNISVYSNKIDHTGWDGMQVSMANKRCQIYQNRITNFGLSNKPAQRAGIVVGGGSTGQVYANHIQIGNGDGIDVFGIGDVRINNNVIIESKNVGIFIGNRTIDNDGNIEVINNTIINSGVDGIRYNNQFAFNSVIGNNLIVGVGYKPISITKGRERVTEVKNFYQQSYDGLHFIDPGSGNFAIGSESKVIDNGMDVSNYQITKDFTGNTRKFGFGTDVGAFEYNVANIKPFSLEVLQPLNLIQGKDTIIYLKDELFVDYDDNDLSFNLTLKNGEELPGWIKLEMEKTIISFNPNKTSVGRIDLVLVARDGAGNISEIALKVVVNASSEVSFSNLVSQLEVIDIEPVKVYPLEIHNFILVETEFYEWMTAAIYLLDSENDLVDTYFLENGKRYIDCRDLRPGPYRMKITNGNRLMIKNVIKK